MNTYKGIKGVRQHISQSKWGYGLAAAVLSGVLLSNVGRTESRVLDIVSSTPPGRESSGRIYYVSNGETNVMHNQVTTHIPPGYQTVDVMYPLLGRRPVVRGFSDK